jgi:outer membrane receptor for ferrienterochelin and colicin
MVEVRRQFKDKKENIISLGGYYQVNTVDGPLVGGEQNLYESSVNALIELPLKDNQAIFAGINGYHSSYTETDLSYKLFYKKKTTEHEAFRFGYSTSVRGPDIFFARIEDTLAYPPPAFTPVLVIGGNPDLENEKFSFTEISYEHRTPASSFQARAYAGTVENRMTGVYTGEPPVDYEGMTLFPAAFVNMEEDNDQFGLTTTWDRRFSEKFRATISYRYLRAKNGDDSTSFYSPKHSANTSITFTPDSKLALNLFTKTYSSYTTDEGFLAGTPAVAGHTKLDFSASLKTTKDGSQSLWFRINNVTDKKTVEAYTNAAFIPGAGYEIGRQITAGYSFRF